MLAAYENDHHTGMDINEMAGLLYDYTCGYPFLVSRLCQIMDETSAPWTREGFLDAEAARCGRKHPVRIVDQ